MSKCVYHTKDWRHVCVPKNECDYPHCEFCMTENCYELFDGFYVCSHCESVLDRYKEQGGLEE